MFEINFWTVIVSAATAFVVSSIYYIALNKKVTQLRGLKSDGSTDSTQMPPWKILLEFARSLVVAYVLARIFVLVGVAEWTDAASLAIWLWIAFPVIILSGSVLYENVPWKLAAIHAGDWLLKLLLIGVILNAWR